MRKLILKTTTLVVLVGVALIIGCMALLQVEPVKTRILAYVCNQIEEASDQKVVIGHADLVFPFDVRLEQIKVLDTNQIGWLSINTLDLTWSPLSLISNDWLVISHLKASNISLTTDLSASPDEPPSFEWPNLPIGLRIAQLELSQVNINGLNMDVKGKMFIKPQGGDFNCKVSLLPSHNHSADWINLSIAGSAKTQSIKVKIQSNILSLKGEGTIDKDLQLQETSLSAQIDNIVDLDLFPPSVEGSSTIKAKLSGSLSSPKATFYITSPEIRINSIPIESLTAEVHASYQGALLQGTCVAHAKVEKIPLSATSDFTLHQLDSLHFSALKFSSSLIEGESDLAIAIPSGLTQGYLSGQIPSLIPWLPHTFSDIKGRAQLRADFGVQEAVNQTVAFTVTAPDLLLDDKIQFSKVTLATQKNAESWSFQLGLKGTQRQPVDLHASGSWLISDADATISLDTLTGEAMSQQVLLKDPLQLHFSKETFSLSPLIIAIGKETLLKASLASQKPLSAHLSLEGQIENIYPFFLLDGFKLSGRIKAELDVSGTAAHPKMKGFVEYSDGSYENLYTGSILTNIQGELLADNALITLTKLTANDRTAGTLLLSGKMTLDHDSDFPFDCSIEAHQASLLNLDNASATAEGQFTFSGNLEEASLKGDLTIAKALFKIPKEIPKTVPTLDVVYINPPPDFQELPSLPPEEPFPLSLDLKITIPNDFTVLGRGLKSEWQGDLHVTNTPNAPSIKGTLNLVKGQFVFSGKSFKLTEGKISFEGNPETDTELKVVGLWTNQELQITAILSGPLSSPNLSFQSDPPLPQRDILSQILFNSSADNINPIQALQLAHSAANLSGKNVGPDVVGSLSKRIGLDQLTVGGPGDDSEEIGVQLGKYVTKELYITLYTSLNAEYNRLIMEANLLRHLILQGEIGEEYNEKILLKWKNDY